MNRVLSGERYLWLKEQRVLLYLGLAYVVLGGILGVAILSQGPFVRPSWIVWQARVQMLLVLTILGAAVAGRRRAFVLSVFAASAFWAFVLWNFARSGVGTSVVFGVLVLAPLLGVAWNVLRRELEEHEPGEKQRRVLVGAVALSVLLDVYAIGRYFAPGGAFPFEILSLLLRESYLLATGTLSLGVLVAAYFRKHRELALALFAGAVIHAAAGSFFAWFAVHRFFERVALFERERIPEPWHWALQGGTRDSLTVAAFDALAAASGLATLVYLSLVHLRVRGSAR